MEFIHFLSIIVSDRIFNTSCLRKADDCCQGQGAGQSCRYQLGHSRGRAAPQPCPGIPRFTGNTCHRGLTVPSPLLHAGGQALENVLKLGVLQRACSSVLPTLSVHLLEMHRDAGHWTPAVRRHVQPEKKGSSAQVVKAEEMALPMSVCVLGLPICHSGHSFTTACFALGCHRDQENT